MMSLIGVRGETNAGLKAVLVLRETLACIYQQKQLSPILFEQMKRRMDIKILGICRIAVMGAGTRRELENWGCYADLCRNSPCSESLGKKALCENVQYR